MRHLSNPLNANAAFSSLSGIALTAVPAQVSDWLGVDATFILRSFGMLLLVHGAILFWAARRENPRPFALLNFLAIAPYPLGMIALVATGVVDTSLGRALVLFDGAVIAIIAVWHAILLRQKQERTTLIPA